MIETDVTRLIGCKHPIFLAPMGPFYTTKATIAISEAGGCGCLSHTNLLGKNSFDEMKKDMLEVIEATDKQIKDAAKRIRGLGSYVDEEDDRRVIFLFNKWLKRNLNSHHFKCAEHQKSGVLSLDIIMVFAVV